MKKLIILNIIAIFVSSCSEDNGKSEAASYDLGVNIYLVNTMGENLIDTDNYQSANYKTYFFNNSVKEFYNPSNFFIINENNITAMRLFFYNYQEDYPVCYIKWNETDTDTLKAHINRGMGNNEDYAVCDKVWLNEELVWDTSTPSGVLGREITIVK